MQTGHFDECLFFLADSKEMSSMWPLNTDSSSLEIFITGLGTPALVASCAGELVIWFVLHAVKGLAKKSPMRLVMFGLRAGMGTLAFFGLFHLVGRFIYLSGNWPLVAVAALGAIVMELIISLYGAERRVSGKAAGQVMLALRLLAVLCPLFMLLQPVYTRDLERRFQREIVVLLDDSQSMRFSDESSTVSEKLRIAALFDVRAATRDQNLTDVQRKLRVIEDRLRIEARALIAPEGVSPSAANALIARRIAPLREFINRAMSETAGLQTMIALERQRFPDIPGTTKQVLSDYDKRIAQNVTAVFGEAAKAIQDGDYRAASAHVDSLARQLRFILERLPDAIRELDQAYFQSLSESDQRIIDDVARRSRRKIAERVLRRVDDGGKTIIDVLGEKYKLRFLRFGRDAGGWEFARNEEDATKPDDAEFDPGRTDFTAALEKVLQQVPAGDLAGVIVLSDGRHNGERGVEEAVRRLALQDAPVCSVVIGSIVGPRDASVVDVRVPESIYLDDRALIQADLKLDGLEGRDITVRLFREDEAIDEQVITVGTGAEASRATVRFSHTPDAKGIFKYSVRIAPLSDELLDTNNRRDFEVAVTDDRIDVLLVDGYPRWEFRYLRNLFYGRDKSVHLQYVLTNPDQIEGAQPAPGSAASASRPFGEAEATALPQSREEWAKFDAIIIGDVPPNMISNDDWRSIMTAVSERGSLLVTIAGPRYMPHAYQDPLFREMLPVIYEPGMRTRFNGPESAYQLKMTAEGSSSLIMQQSANPEINEMVWGSLPPLMWRYQPDGIKAGAEILAYAQPLGEGELSIEEQRSHSLIVAQRYALGKSLALNFDRTWRLRYGVGDIYHHKFWGQVLRWAAGENLRAGNDLVRLGTDRLTYAPGDPVNVMAKVLTESYVPLIGGTVAIGLYRDDKLILRKSLKPRADSNGMHDTMLERITEPGRYRLVLESPEVRRILTAIGKEDVETEFIVEEPSDRIELTELAANPVFLESLAALSAGAVADPDDAASLLNFLGDPGKIVRERRETSLWDNLILLGILLVLITAEWLVRRKAGLT